MKKSTVTAEVWVVWVSEGIMGFIHGQISPISEIYIPSERIAFNVDNGHINCFKPDRGRYTGKKLHDEQPKSKKVYEIEIPVASVKAMKKYFAADDALKGIKGWASKAMEKADKDIEKMNLNKWSMYDPSQSVTVSSD